MAWSRRPKGTRSRYGAQHRALRRAWAERLQLVGSVPCCRCGQPVIDGSDWHLDHADDGVHYRGVAHASCNVRAAARRAGEVVEARARGGLRTSRAW